MKSHHLRRTEHEDGFTLVELLVVILIIGILAAVAVPAFLNQRKAAVDASVESDVKNIAEQASQIYYANPGAALTKSSLESSLGTMKLSGQTQWEISAKPHQGFCVTAWSVGSGQYTSATNPASYDSEGGGLNAKGVSCPKSWTGFDFTAAPWARISGDSKQSVGVDGWQAGDTVEIMYLIPVHDPDSTPEENWAFRSTARLVVPEWSYNQKHIFSADVRDRSWMNSAKWITRTLTESDVAKIRTGVANNDYIHGLEGSVVYTKQDGTQVEVPLKPTGAEYNYLQQG